MNKTSVYLSDEERERLAYLAQVEGKSQAEIIRAAIRQYRCAEDAGREFEIIGVASVSGLSAAELANEDDALEGFGE